MEDSQETLLCLPKCDVERPDIGASRTGKGIDIKSKNKSIKTTAKRADFVLFELPNRKQGKIHEDLLEGRCKILANGKYASLVTPSTSLKLVTVGSSNALVVWNKDIITHNDNNSSSANTNTDLEDESPTKRRKINTTAPMTVAPCRLIQPGGDGSSFLVGQPRDLDPMELSQFFAKRGFDDSISTSKLCNLFQVAPNQIWDAMLWIPSVVSKHEDLSEDSWQLVPDEDVLFGQRALVETLCEEDDNFSNEDDHYDGNNISDQSTTVTIETMAVNVCRRLLPLLLERSSPETGNGEKEKESRCLAIARKTVLLSSSSSYSTKIKTKTKLNDFNRPFQSDASRIAFYALRDLFMKYPSYAVSDLQKKWSTRLPMGERYEGITSTTEWIEDGKIGGHGGLVPNQLYFSPTAPNSDNNDDMNLDGSTSKSKTNEIGNSKAVLSLVDPKAVLVWKGGKH